VIWTGVEAERSLPVGNCRQLSAFSAFAAASIDAHPFPPAVLLLALNVLTLMQIKREL